MIICFTVIRPPGRLLRVARKDSNLLPPSGEVARGADRGLYVILSASEISHDQSEKVYALTENHPPESLPQSLFALFVVTTF